MPITSVNIHPPASLRSDSDRHHLETVIGIKSESVITFVGIRTSVCFNWICSSEGEVTMSGNVNEVIRKLSPADRKKVEHRAAEIIAEEMTLRDLREARKLT
jgi:hypothetical protein